MTDLKIIMVLSDLLGNIKGIITDVKTKMVLLDLLDYSYRQLMKISVFLECLQIIMIFINMCLTYLLFMETTLTINYRLRV